MGPSNWLSHLMSSVIHIYMSGFQFLQLQKHLNLTRYKTKLLLFNKLNIGYE